MLTGWTTKLLSMAPALIDWLVKYKGALASTCVTLLALIAYKKRMLPGRNYRWFGMKNRCIAAFSR